MAIKPWLNKPQSSPTNKPSICFWEKATLTTCTVSGQKSQPVITPYTKVFQAFQCCIHTLLFPRILRTHLASHPREATLSRFLTNGELGSQMGQKENGDLPLEHNGQAEL
uniref:Uncharacterized protein n=1 Tax=Micrurus surinamensis TaxID=129470 RepID=A0A2D4PY54_MICSU